MSILWEGLSLLLRASPTLFFSPWVIWGVKRTWISPNRERSFWQDWREYMTWCPLVSSDTTGLMYRLQGLLLSCWILKEWLPSGLAIMLLAPGRLWSFLYSEDQFPDRYWPPIVAQQPSLEASANNLRYGFSSRDRPMGDLKGIRLPRQFLF